MIQIKINLDNGAIKSCAFTGHRQLLDDFSPKALKTLVRSLVKDGVRTFYVGMAEGFDLAAAEVVLREKKKDPSLKLVACIPFYGQERRFSDEDKKRYAAILRKADEQVYVSEHYRTTCFFERNRYMADRADVLVAYLNQPKGGTAYTVRYFQKKKPSAPVYFLGDHEGIF